MNATKQRLGDITPETKLKKEWSAEDFTKMKTAIKKHLTYKTIYTREFPNGTTLYDYSQIENLLGLAYTSSSDFAGEWICNTELKENKASEFKYIGFAMTEGGKPVGILWDADENEKIIKL